MTGTVGGESSGRRYLQYVSELKSPGQTLLRLSAWGLMCPCATDDRESRMLSYLHAFHAGNFADVQKHAALCLIHSMMQAKPSPITCFDTHAGSALYNLDDARAEKTGEAESGIQAVWSRRQALASEDWSHYLDTLTGLNPAASRLRLYPGSPAWLASRKRTDDRVVVFELHPTEQARLTDWAADRGDVTVRCADGLTGLLRSLPPGTPRLLVVIDPSYEIRKDYQVVASTLVSAWQRCRHGVFLIWYPILPGNPARALLDGLKSSPVTKVLRSELELTSPPERGMSGSGLLVINPPWGFGERFERMMDEVGGEGLLNASHRLDWWVPETGA